jgi:hypothetical protein
MIIRIRLGNGPRVRRNHRKNQHLALGLAALLTPVAVMAIVLACWRLSADLRVSGEFPIGAGLFSHWQVWLTGAAIVEFLAIILNRYGNAEPVLQEPVEESEAYLANP